MACFIWLSIDAGNRGTPRPDYDHVPTKAAKTGGLKARSASRERAGMLHPQLVYTD